MKYQLTAHEARVIGCLLEKQVTTPEQYPLSVNAVVTACNQKTNREPVMSLSESEVQALLDTLVKRHYLRTVSGFGNRVTKYEQRFCNSEFGDLKLSAGEVAVVTTLLLRGAQTPGELRSRAQRMYEFSDMAEVESVLEGLTTFSVSLAGFAIVFSLMEATHYFGRGRRIFPTIWWRASI